MADLLFWFLVSQTLSGLPEMSAGTEVRVLSDDLFSIMASATVEDGKLVFDTALEPNSEVRLLVLSRDADENERVAALSKALSAEVSEKGDDLYLRFEELEGPVSFSKWLAEERDIVLVLVLPESEDSPGGEDASEQSSAPPDESSDER